MRLQCSTEILFGSSEAVATARRSGVPGVAAGARISIAGGVPCVAAGAPIAIAGAGAAGAGAGVAAVALFAPESGVMGAGTGASAAGDALGAPACGSSLHAFGLFLRRATPSRGFGVTSARHDERAAKTPW